MSDYIFSSVSPALLPEAYLAQVQSLVKDFGGTIFALSQLSENHLYAMDFTIHFPGDETPLKTSLMDLSNRWQVDAALIPAALRGKQKLIVFDMDSTLIQHEVIDEMAAVYGIGDKVKAITERTMNGELNFDEALRERVGLLKGLERKELERIYTRLKLSPGVEKLIRELKARGFKTGIISGGFRYFAENFKVRLNMDYAFANELEWDGEKLTGKILGDIINAQAKARIVEELAQRDSLSLDQVIAVGDGANDLLMLAKAGFGVAFHAKEKVRKEARFQVGQGPMTTLLYFLGYTGNHFDETL